MLCYSSLRKMSAQRSQLRRSKIMWSRVGVGLSSRPSFPLILCYFAKVEYTPPWLSRVDELQSTAMVNADTERTVVKLNEELRELAKTIRAKVSCPKGFLPHIEADNVVSHRTKLSRKALYESTSWKSA